MKKVLTIIIVICIFLIGYIASKEETAELVSEKLSVKQVGDFILHMKVEKESGGVNILKSLQYIGEGTVEIKHQTPLVSVSLKHKNHDYTGSLVSKRLEKGSIYTQETETIKYDEKGDCDIFVQANFTAEGEEVIIEHAEELKFQ